MVATIRGWFKLLRKVARESLWFVPGVMTVLAGSLAILLMLAEEQGFLWTGDPPWWVYQGGPEAAHDVLTSITTSLITVTGVVFSVTIVAVQLSSSQYTPRVFRDFSSDRGNQIVFGIFIGTFTHAFLVLRTIRGAGEGYEEVLPRLAVTVSGVFLLISVGALIYFINHLARQMHVTALLDRVTKGTLVNVHKLFPEHIGVPAQDQLSAPEGHPSLVVCTREAGYVRMVDEDRLFGIRNRSSVVINMEVKIGDHVLQGRPIATVWTDDEPDEDLEREVHSAFTLGPERSPDQDVEFGLVEISDIAIKSLSASINDPTTAIRCIDQLAELLVELGTRDPPETRRTRDGRIHFIAKYTTFERAVAVAFDDIRHYGAATPIIATHLIEIFGGIRATVKEAYRHVLVEHGEAVLQTAREQVTNKRDLLALDRSAAQLTRADNPGVSTR